MQIVLIGAGGHARNIVEMLGEHELIGYIDLKQCDWLSVPRWTELDLHVGAVLGIGGVTPESLKRRVGLLNRVSPALIHPRATVSPTAVISEGAQIMAGAIVQANAKIGRAAIINTGSIIEHDVTIGEGAHVAPGAIVLGGATVGSFAMIGAGAVILPGSDVPSSSMVKAGERYPNKARSTIGFINGQRMFTERAIRQ